MFHSIKAGLITSCLMFAIGDAVPDSIPMIGPFTQLGALGVLGWAVWVQQTELRELRKTHGEVIGQLRDSWDEWERMRHADSEKLDATLREMTARCAETQTHLKKNANES